MTTKTMKKKNLRIYIKILGARLLLKYPAGRRHQLLTWFPNFDLSWPGHSLFLR